MDDASAVADAIDALRDDLDVVKALDTRRGAPHPPHASSHPPDARRRRPPSAVFPFRADLTLTRATTQGADRLDDPPRRRAGPRDGDRGDARVREGGVPPSPRRRARRHRPPRTRLDGDPKEVFTPSTRLPIFSVSPLGVVVGVHRPDRGPFHPHRSSSHRNHDRGSSPTVSDRRSIVRRRSRGGPRASKAFPHEPSLPRHRRDAPPRCLRTRPRRRRRPRRDPPRRVATDGRRRSDQRFDPRARRTPARVRIRRGPRPCPDADFAGAFAGFAPDRGGRRGGGARDARRRD